MANTNWCFGISSLFMEILYISSKLHLFTLIFLIKFIIISLLVPQKSSSSGPNLIWDRICKYLMILFMLFFLMFFVCCVRCTWNSHFSHNEIIIILVKSNVSMRRKKRSACKTKMGWFYFNWISQHDPFMEGKVEGRPYHRCHI